MEAHVYLIVLTLIALVMQFVMGFKQRAARPKLKVMVPAISGNLEFERMFRAHQNTMEYMPMFLIFLWFAGLTGGNTYWVSLLGLVWIVARVFYFKGYTQGTANRGKAFQVTALMLALLLLTTLYNLIMM